MTFKVSTKRLIAVAVSLFLGFAGSVVAVSQANAAPVALTVSRIGWNVIGLDSNDVNSGPNTYPQAYKVCNTSTDTAATNVEADWGWTTANALINLDGSANREIGTIAANSCVSFYWTVTVARNASAYDTSRNYKVTVSDGTVTADTGTQIVYVEHLVSQNRNVIRSVTGPTSVTLGQTVQFVLSGATATQGYEQIVTAPIMTSSIFEIKSVTGSYAVGGNITTLYFDACGWDPAGVDVTTWDCLGVGKAGGDPITVTVTAKVIGTGSAAIGGVIYDFSGSSFHYNSDYDASVLNVTAGLPAPTINAVNESETTDVDEPVEIDVLANDTANNGTIKIGSVTITQEPAFGTLFIDPVTFKVTYTPDPGYVGTDSFKYSIETNEDSSVKDEATVTITIKDPADPEVTVDEGVKIDGQLEIDPTTLDPNAPEIDPTTVEITEEPGNGTVTVDPTTGEITYTPDPGYKGKDSFKFRAASLTDPTVFVDYVYNVYVSESGLANTGSDLSGLFLLTLILLISGLALLAAKQLLKVEPKSSTEI